MIDKKITSDSGEIIMCTIYRQYFKVNPPDNAMVTARYKKRNYTK